jgi:hypothetical protein
MGEPPGTGQFSVPPGEVPTVFVDVIYDETIGGQLHGNAFGLCYSAAGVSHAVPRGSYALTLRLDGADTHVRKRFTVDQDPATGLVRMHELELGFG